MTVGEGAAGVVDEVAPDAVGEPTLERSDQLLDDLRRRLELTVVTAMHDLTLAAQYADHLVLLTAGRITLSGPAAQVLTATQLERHYGARVDVIRHRGNLVVVPWREPPNHNQEESQ